MAWLGTWANRQRIEIDNVDIDSDLTFFPIPIVLGSSVGKNNFNTADIFNNIGDFTNRKKIAITKEDGTTQLYGEIEFWNQAEGKAIIWVSKPDFVISSSNKTILYFYYDSAQSENTSYIGDTGDVAAQNVWDSGYKAVYHMAQDPSAGGACILDSTSNANHGTPHGAMTSDNLVDGEFGKALSFDGVDDYIQLPCKIPIGAKTISQLVYPIDAAHELSDDYLFGEGNNSADTYGNAIFWRHSLHKFLWLLFHHVGSDYLIFLYSSELTPANWYPYTLTWDGTTNSNGVKCYIAGNLDTQGTATGIETVIPSNNTRIGLDYSSTDRQFKGLISQVQISDIVRSDAWVKATYKAQTDSLISFGIAFSGTVTSGGVGISRKINFYEEPDLSTSIGSVVSETDGTWEIILGVNPSAYVTAICEGDVGEQSQIFNKISAG